MQLNKLKPAVGAKTARKRVGRGIGSGLGKTCGLGHKGQRARAGGYHKVGFEGGQMPLQRRLPKFGFVSRKALVSTEISVHALLKLNATSPIDLAALKAANLVNKNIKRVKVIGNQAITQAIVLKGIAVTRGARAAIEAAGGKIEV